MALMVAPAAFLFFAYASAQPLLLAWAFHPLRRLINLLVLLWAALIGLKALTVAHHMSWKQALQTMIGSAIFIYIFAPILLTIVIGYLLF